MRNIMNNISMNKRAAFDNMENNIINVLDNMDIPHNGVKRYASRIETHLSNNYVLLGFVVMDIDCNIIGQRFQIVKRLEDEYGLYDVLHGASSELENLLYNMFVLHDEGVV